MNMSYHPGEALTAFASDDTVESLVYGARRTDAEIEHDRATRRRDHLARHARLIDWNSEQARLADRPATTFADRLVLGATAPKPAPRTGDLRWTLRIAAGVCLGIVLGGMASDALLYAGLWPIAEASF